MSNIEIPLSIFGVRHSIFIIPNHGAGGAGGGGGAANAWCGAQLLNTVPVTAQSDASSIKVTNLFFMVLMFLRDII